MLKSIIRKLYLEKVNFTLAISCREIYLGRKLTFTEFVSATLYYFFGKEEAAE